MVSLAVGTLGAHANPGNLSAAWRINGNGFPGDVTVQQAPDGSLSGSIYGDRISGHYAPGTGTLAFQRFTGSQPVQLYIGAVTPQGISGEFYALTVRRPAVGASAPGGRLRSAAVAGPTAARSRPSPSAMPRNTRAGCSPR